MWRGMQVIPHGGGFRHASLRYGGAYVRSALGYPRGPPSMLLDVRAFLVLPAPLRFARQWEKLTGQAWRGRR